MGLLAAGNPSHGQASGTSERGGDEIRERENRARARLVGPGLAARASGTAGSGEPAGRGRRAGQKAVARRTGTRRPARRQTKPCYGGLELSIAARQLDSEPF